MQANSDLSILLSMQSACVAATFDFQSDKDNCSTTVGAILNLDGGVAANLSLVFPMKPIQIP
jgi:hypothetical protein